MLPSLAEIPVSLKSPLLLGLYEFPLRAVEQRPAALWEAGQAKRNAVTFCGIENRTTAVGTLAGHAEDARFWLIDLPYVGSASLSESLCANGLDDTDRKVRSAFARRTSGLGRLRGRPASC